LATTNDYEFYDQMKLFACSFKDGHTNVYFNDFGVYTDYISITAKYFGNELYIIRAREDIERNIPVGSKILEVNGISVGDYMKKNIEPYIDSDFEPTVKHLSAAKLFSSDLSSNILTVKYMTPDNKIMTNTLPRDGKTQSGNTIGYLSTVPKKAIEINWIENDIAILCFNTFNDVNGRLVSAFDELKDTLYAAKGIIIDLRQNRGGSTDVAWHLLQYIIKESYFLNFAWQTRINDGVKKANGNWKEENEDFYKNCAYRTVMPDTIFIPDTIKRFDVPIAILISAMTVSAAEDLLIILYEISNRPIIIGQPSFGSTGSPLMVWGFPKNGYARVCTRKVLFPYSLKPFSDGITPDILVNYSFDEFMSGKDKDIEIAVQELKKQIITPK
jgi:C-terminal processing protease CtpA/Prc